MTRIATHATDGGASAPVAPPSALETHLPDRHPRPRGAPGDLPWPPRAAAALLALLAPVAVHAADAQAGRAKAAACTVCHGELGLSQQPDVPHLAGQPEVYLSGQLKAYRSGKRLHEVMGILAKALSDADIADLAAWYASIELKADARKK